jgi:hypothetical protein
MQLRVRRRRVRASAQLQQRSKSRGGRQNGSWLAAPTHFPVQVQNQFLHSALIMRGLSARRAARTPSGMIAILDVTSYTPLHQRQRCY